MHQSTFDEKDSFQPFGIVIFKHGEDLCEGDRGVKARPELVERLKGGSDLSVSFDGGFPDVLQPESLAVVDQSDGFDVLPQLRGDENTSQEGGRRWKDGTREQEFHPNLLRLPPTLLLQHLRVSDLHFQEVLLAR